MPAIGSSGVESDGASGPEGEAEVDERGSSDGPEDERGGSGVVGLVGPTLPEAEPVVDIEAVVCDKP